MTATAHRHEKRLPAALAMLLWALLGAGSALLLGLFMYTLIHAHELNLSDSKRVQMLDFVRLKRDEVADRKDRKPERPPPNQAPDIPPMEQSSAASSETLAVSALQPPGEGIDVARSNLGVGSGDGEYLPIVKVAPIYPRRALSRGISGECVVRYTVTTAGTVKDVEIVEDMCTDVIFHRPSVEAAKRFKYKPRVIDGEPVEVTGVYNRFYYELDDENGRIR